MLCTQETPVIVESSDKTWSAGGGNGNPLQYSCCKNHMNSMKKWEGAQIFAVLTSFPGDSAVYYRILLPLHRLFSDVTMHQNSLEELLKHKLLVPPQSFWFVTYGWRCELAFLRNSLTRLSLVKEPQFANLCFTTIVFIQKVQNESHGHFVKTESRACPPEILT